ncbi:MAG: hypothetical protein HUU15_19490, partial [Candidatus Brocadiae bacterium]|nr:hypothetical protein [Candidatus Brocadiia bacterium]
VLTTDEADRRARVRPLAAAGVPFEVFELLARRLDLAELPADATFEFTIAASGATTECRVAAPRGVPAGARLPLLLTLHTTSEPADFRRNRFARTLTAAGWIVAAPHSSPNFGKGWGSREVERSVAVSALDALLRRYPVDPDRVFLNGASMGGNGCWEIGMLHRDRFAGLAPNIAGPRIRNFPLLVNLGGLPLLSTIGADEDALMVEANREAIAFLRDGLGSPARLHEEPAWGHVEKPEEWDPRLVQWGAELGRDVFPRGLVHHFALESQFRHHWIRAERTSGVVVDPTEGKIPVDARGTEAQRRAEYVTRGRARCARLAARVDGQTIRIATRSAPKVTLWLSDALVDLSRPVTVELNGKQVFKGTVERSLETLVTEIAASRDTGRVFAARLILPK